LLLNPTLSDLVGGIESVTLSDEEARRRGTQKTVLERRSPPTFDVLIEIQTRDRLVVHQDVAAAVDTLLRGFPMTPEIRSRIDGDIRIEKAELPRVQGNGQQGYRRQSAEMLLNRPDDRRSSGAMNPPRGQRTGYTYLENGAQTTRDRTSLQSVRVYPYGVARNRLSQAARRLGVPALIVNEPGEAEVLVTLRSYYRKRQQPIMEAEQRNVPIYVLLSNTVNQMQQFLCDLFNLYTMEGSDPGSEAVMQETQAAITAVMNGERWVELRPAASSIRRMQHQMARDANLVSHSYGKEPNRRVRIFRES